MCHKRVKKERNLEMLRVCNLVVRSGNTMHGTRLLHCDEMPTMVSIICNIPPPQTERWCWRDVSVVCYGIMQTTVITACCFHSNANC
jgi:hypothetical protein